MSSIEKLSLLNSSIGNHGIAFVIWFLIFIDGIEKLSAYLILLGISAKFDTKVAFSNV